MVHASSIQSNKDVEGQKKVSNIRTQQTKKERGKIRKGVIYKQQKEKAKEKRKVCKIDTKKTKQQGSDTEKKQF